MHLPIIVYQVNRSVQPASQHPPAADKTPAQVYLESLKSEASRVSMRSTLNMMAKMFAQQHGLEAEAVKAVTADTLRWENLRYKHTSNLRAKLAQVYKPATANKCLSALKGVLKVAWLQNQIDTDSYMRAIALERIKGSSLPAGRALSTDEVIALFAACAADCSPAGARDAAAFALMYGAGLRRSEAVVLKIEDYDPATGKIRIIGKGNKERQVYAINGGAEALGAWLAHRETAPGPLLHPVNKAGNISHGATITGQALMYALKKRCKQAAINECSPHDLRRSFISDLLDAGADISVVQDLAGHASVNITAIYDRRGERTARRVADIIHVPYTRPDRLA